jgi:predicted double-glycine peptidase
MLAVPYIKQINSNACGAAALEMVYKFYGVENLSQDQLMQKYQEFEPHGSGNYRMSSDALVNDARERNFDAVLFRADYTDKQNCLALLNDLVEVRRIPVIVCQKFTNEQHLMGHFRVVIGVSEDSVYLHDPFLDVEGNEAQWTLDQFVEFWQPTGENVTGGIGCLIAPSGALDFLQQEA